MVLIMSKSKVLTVVKASNDVPGDNDLGDEELYDSNDIEVGDCDDEEHSRAFRPAPVQRIIRSNGNYTDVQREEALRLFLETGSIKTASAVTGIPIRTIQQWILASTEALRITKRGRAVVLADALEKAILKVITKIMEDDEKYSVLDPVAYSVMVKNLAAVWNELNNPDKNNNRLTYTRINESEQGTVTPEGDVKKLLERNFEQWVLTGKEDDDCDSGANPLQ